MRIHVFIMSGLVCKSGRLVHKFAGSGLKIGAARISFADVRTRLRRPFGTGVLTYGLLSGVGHPASQSVGEGSREARDVGTARGPNLRLTDVWYCHKATQTSILPYDNAAPGIHR